MAGRVVSRKTLGFFGLCTLCLLLSACVTILSEDMDIELRPKETWAMQVQFTVPAAEAQANALLFNQSLNEFVADIQAKGSSAEWQILELDEEGHQPYRITMSGQGYDTLNNGVFGGETVITRDDDSSNPQQLHFQLGTNDISIGEAFQTTFTLRGGKILTSNGTQTNNTTVTWANPAETMEAVLLEPSVIHWQAILFILVGVGVVGAGILQWRRSSQAIPTPQPTRYFPQDDPPQRLFVNCGHCVTQMPAEAKFCPNCGRERM